MILWRNFFILSFNTNPRFPPFLLYVRCKSGVTFVWRCFRDETLCEDCHFYTVSHFSSAPLINCKISLKRNMILTRAERINVCQRRIISNCVCIIHRKLIVIGSETNEAKDPEGHYSLHCISDHIILFSLSNFCHVIG